MTRTYLDHNATSPIRPEVIEAVSAAMAVEGNPSAQHGDGRAANNLISNARESLGLAMGVCAQDVVFTGCGTEALNTAVPIARAENAQLPDPSAEAIARSSGGEIIRQICGCDFSAYGYDRRV